MKTLSPILLLSLPSCRFPSNILTLILYEIHTAAIRATIPIQLTTLIALTYYRKSTENALCRSNKGMELYWNSLPVFESSICNKDMSINKTLYVTI
jgi:hypothetical protein